MKKLKLALLGAAGLFFISNEANAQVQWNGTVNSGIYASAIGGNTNATGNYSFSTGYQTTASGYSSTSFGVNSVASGFRSFALGFASKAESSTSFAAGTYAEVGLTAYSGVAIGIKVTSNANRAMVIGSGYYEKGGGAPIALVNNIENSLMIGFRSNLPTLFVGPSSGPFSTGRVGIGTTNTPTSIGGENISSYRLFVAGGILTEEVRVRTGWADYVFDDSYELMPLQEVGTFIQTNGHLPNVPSAEQVEEEGIEIGEMTRIQQEKIEELTLYMIEMQKEIDALKAQLDEKENN